MFRTAFFLLAAAAPLAANAQSAPAPAPPGTAPAAAAPAPTGGAVSVGTTIYDTEGATVGTVASTDGTNAVVDTGTVKAAVPLSSFGTSPKGPVLAMTKAQLEAAAGQGAAQAAASFQSQLSAGATVYGVAGTSVGTIKAVDPQFVTLTTPDGEARLPVGSFGPGPKGVTIGMSAEQLKAAMAGQ